MSSFGIKGDCQLRHHGHIRKLHSQALSSTFGVTPSMSRLVDAAPAARGSIVAKSALVSWDSAQKLVIEAAPNASIIVEAGPGTGKTEVACGRIAHLIRQGMEPSNILLISFTRTAVAELRHRIACLSESETRARAVRITTLDSAAWQLRYGFSEEEVAKLFGSYESNIQEVIEQLKRGHDGILEFLERIEHLIVDEAQDLVGIRAELVGELIRCIQSTAGVTINADSAQAIYGFTTEEGSKGTMVGVPLPTRLATNGPGKFSQLSIT
jgi:superfamily I DNA/RNA helicase